ncbi:MAG: hypothetical protein ABIL68_14010 [bacterium]
MGGWPFCLPGSTSSKTIEQGVGIRPISLGTGEWVEIGWMDRFVVHGNPWKDWLTKRPILLVLFF